MSYGLGRAHRAAIRGRPQSLRPQLDFTFGETPWRSIRRILRLTDAQADSKVLELGSGTGRFSLFAAYCLGLEAEGLELVRPFVRRANQVAAGLALKRCRFRETDFFEPSWRDATILYAVSTAFADETRREIDRKCEELSPGARIVTTSYAPCCPSLALEHTEVLDFSWGPTAVFVMCSQ